MQSPRPQLFRIDVTQMFNTVSIRAIDMTSQHMGGFDKLSDMCCHLAIMVRNGLSQLDIKLKIAEIIYELNIAEFYQRSMYDVVMIYITTINNNFLTGLSISQQNKPINHVKILDAKHDYNVRNTTRQYVTCDFVAAVYGY